MRRAKGTHGFHREPGPGDAHAADATAVPGFVTVRPESGQVTAGEWATGVAPVLDLHAGILATVPNLITMTVEPRPQ